MNRTRKLIATFLVLLMALTLCVSADEVYSSQNDPLISLSYLEDIFGPRLLDEMLKKVDAEYVKITDISVNAGGSYTLATLLKGQALMADTALEVVLISGTGTVIVTASGNLNAGVGISDLTSGSVVTNGNPLPQNHYLVIPKPDGRGFLVTSEEAIVLVRGEYHITD